MIAVINVEITAANPSMPLFPWRAYVNSPSSLRIRNVPRRVGNWNIDKVYVSAAYPDNSIKSAECVLVGGIWVCTIAGSTSTGFSQNGYTIFADGKDENGNEVTGYVLGKGDITILEADGTITPGEDTYYVHMLSAEPSTPKDGDLWQLSGSWYIYQDGTAYPIGDDSGLISQLSTELSNKADISSLSDYALSSDLSSKQDKLSDQQISAIDSVVDERATIITFTDNTTSSFNWVGEINCQTMIDEGLYDGSNFFWIKNPVTVKIGNAITSIGQSAFRTCDYLSNVIIPDSVTEIGKMAFSACALTGITIPNSVTNIDDYAFDNGYSLSNIIIPDNVITIGDGAFRECWELTSVIIGNSVISIGNNAFKRYESTLNEITVKGKTYAEAEILLSGTGYPETCQIKTWNDASQEWVADNYATNIYANAISALAQYASDKANQIDDKIPAQTWNTGNELADKAFVNSSVQTATANFRGNWSTWADVPSVSSDYPEDYAGSKVPTVNDYLVVQDASDLSSTYEGTWRFKYIGTWATDGKNGWLPEYQVNETPMTAAQLAALNSGITAQKVLSIDLIPNKADLSVIPTSADYVAVITDSSNKKTAVTIGDRATGSVIGPNSFAVGTLNQATSTACIAIGTGTVANNVFSQGYGAFVTASGLISQAMGFQTTTSHNYAFSWNGNNTAYYASKAEGAFCINPKNGLNGFYIGEQPMANIVVQNVNGIAKIQSISEADYAAISATADLSTLYVIPEEA